MHQRRAGVATVRPVREQSLTVAGRNQDGKKRKRRRVARNGVVPMTAHDGQEPERLRVAQPLWDGTHLELLWRGIVVKRLNVTATNQILVLAAFAEEGWPRMIDDPLPGRSERDPQKRLRNTIQRLNLGQEHPLLRFRANGTGSGIRWEPTPLGSKLVSLER